jgi:hypothetical protein
MSKSVQKSLNSLVVNWVLLSVIMLLGSPNLYMISLMNSTSFAAVIEATCFTLIHFVNLSTATNICVNPPMSFLKRTYQIKPSCGERPSDTYGLQLMRRHVSLAGKKLTTFTPMNKGVRVRYDSGPREPMPVCLPYEWPCTHVTITNPCMNVLQNSIAFIWGDAFYRVPLTLHQKSSSFTRVYCPAWWCNHSRSTLSFGGPPVLRCTMNRVCQSESISITLGDSVMFSLGGVVSWDDSTTLVALAKAFEMLGSWSSCKKNPVKIIAQLELNLANSSTISFFLVRYASTQDHWNCFLTCGAPSHTTTFWHPDMTTLCSPD